MVTYYKFVWIVNSEQRRTCINMTAFWVASSFSVVEIYRRFGDASCLSHQVSFYQTTWRKIKKTDIFVLFAMRTWHISMLLLFLLNGTPKFKLHPVSLDYSKNQDNYLNIKTNAIQYAKLGIIWLIAFGLRSVVL